MLEKPWEITVIQAISEMRYLHCYNTVEHDRKKPCLDIINITVGNFIQLLYVEAEMFLSTNRTISTNHMERRAVFFERIDDRKVSFGTESACSTFSVCALGHFSHGFHSYHDLHSRQFLAMYGIELESGIVTNLARTFFAFFPQNPPRPVLSVIVVLLGINVVLVDLCGRLRRESE